MNHPTAAEESPDANRPAESVSADDEVTELRLRLHEGLPTGMSGSGAAAPDKQRPGTGAPLDGDSTQVFQDTIIEDWGDEAEVTMVMPSSQPPTPASPRPPAVDTGIPDAPGASQTAVRPGEGEVTVAAGVPSTAVPATNPSAEPELESKLGPVLEMESAAKPGPVTWPSVAGSTGVDGTPRRMERYEIRRRLGQGGMATVYLAHDPKIGRDVALKLLHPSLSADDECRTRFMREARAAGSLSHPHIVIVHDVGEIDGTPFMAMELLEGDSLAEVLEKEQVLPIRDVVSLGIELGAALEYAHGKGVVHRDIKPANIMMLPDHRGIKVTDFGIAHIEQAGVQQHTVVGAVLGTPQYMSPEQARGDKLDGRSDLFSVGIVLYQALTGDRPFKGETMFSIAQQITSTVPPPITTRRPDTPPSLRRVVEKCLAKQPEQRFASGAELGRALRRVAAELDAAAAEKHKPRILPLRLKWALMMAGIVALVMGVAATVITQRQYSALLAQASDYGAAFTRFIGRQNAAQMLSEEWEVIDVAVQEAMRTRNFERITVIDKGGIVRVSTIPDLVGKPYKSAATPIGSLAGEVSASRYDTPAGPVLGFDAPVTFRDQQVGRVMLGVPERPLAQVARLSITLMVVLAVVTVAAVAVAMYFVANWFAKPIKLVVESMEELSRGHYGHRIAETRSDEFGELFTAFDRLAGALQRRAESEPGTSPSLTLAPTMDARPAAQAGDAAATPSPAPARPQRDA